MNIIFIVEDNGVQQEMVNIPVVQNIEPVNCETEDEEFTTINGKKLNLIGGKGLRNFSFSSFLLFYLESVRSDLYSVKFINTNLFFEKYRDARVPLRIIIVDKYRVVLNMLCRYNFTYSFRDKAGDVPYTLDIKEYILPGEADNNV